VNNRDDSESVERLKWRRAKSNKRNFRSKSRIDKKVTARALTSIGRMKDGLVTSIEVRLPSA
jgi:hypothetical protein